MTDTSDNAVRSSKEIDVIRAWMQTQWERIPATPHSQPGSYARGYDGGMVDILRGLQATLDKLPPAHETRAPQRYALGAEGDICGAIPVMNEEAAGDWVHWGDVKHLFEANAQKASEHLYVPVSSGNDRCSVCGQPKGQCSALSEGEDRG